VQTSSCLKKPLSETIVINETKSANCVKDERRLSRLSDILNRILDFPAFYPVPQKTLGILQKINPVFAKTKK
jgi:hypothetical protein